MDTSAHPNPFSNVADPTSHLDIMSSSPTYIKMEDVHTSQASPCPSQLSFSQMSINARESSQFNSAPPPVIIRSKPARKRKAWGTELPEPTTALPPRKRAKTAGEKEQRRIERIKRNRAAAHNSRERKREEAEKLAVLLAKANAELDVYRRLHGPLPSDVILPEVITMNVDEPHPTPTSMLNDPRSPMSVMSPLPARACDTFEAENNVKPDSSPMSYPVAQFPFVPKRNQPVQSKPTQVSPKQATPTQIKAPSATPSPFTPYLDPTQHSAAMLCDLQCRSSRGDSNKLLAASLIPAAASWWSNLFLSLMVLRFRTTCQTMLLALWTISPSRMARLMTPAFPHPSTSPSTTSSTTPRPPVRRSMVLAQRNAATAVLDSRQLRAAPARILSPPRDESCWRQKVLEERRGQRPHKQHAREEDATMKNDDQKLRSDTDDGVARP